MCCTSGNVRLRDNQDVSHCQYLKRQHRLGRPVAIQWPRFDLPDRADPLHSPRATKRKGLPSMMSGMTFFDRDENPPAGGADFSIGGQGPFKCSAIGYVLDTFC